MLKLECTGYKENIAKITCGPATHTIFLFRLRTQITRYFTFEYHQTFVEKVKFSNKKLFESSITLDFNRLPVQPDYSRGCIQVLRWSHLVVR